MNAFITKLKKDFENSDLVKSPMFQKYRVLVVPIVVLIFSILIAILVTIPQIFNLYNTYQTISGLQTKLTFYQNKSSQLESINLTEYRKDLDTALIALPVDKDIPGVMGELLVALGGSGMTLNSITFSQPPKDSDKVVEYSVSIKASGTDENLKSFLQRITLTPRLVKLAGIEVDQSSTGNINASLTFVTFFQNLPSGAGAIDDKVPSITSADTQILSDIEAKQKQFPKATVSQSQGGVVGKVDPFSP